MIIDQINNSPFVTKEFLDLVLQLDSPEKTQSQHDFFSVKDGTIKCKGSRDFIDYRPSLKISSQTLEKLNCSNISLDSLHFEQVREIAESFSSNSIKIMKSDQVVNLVLPDSYGDYINELPRKKKHELKRKKTRFEKKYPEAELKQSKDDEIFNIFVELHKTSEGEKGAFMEDNVVSFFRELLATEGWKIYYLEIKKEIAACCFVFEDEVGSYLYNSSKNKTFNEVNPGIMIIDKIIEKLINENYSFFDFLKGTERYKFDLGGTSTQLYDIEINL